ncbi:MULTISPECIES: hypothetical protein [unclassified Microcoleus]
MPALFSRLLRAGEADANTKVGVFIAFFINWEWGIGHGAWGIGHWE